MSLRPSLSTACRALALRSRPLIPRPESFVLSIPRRRYADDSSPIPPIRPTNGLSANSTAPETLHSQQSTRGGETVAEQSVRLEELDALDELDTSAVTDADLLGALDWAAGQEDGPVLEGGLTREQEETLYQEGSIPPLAGNGTAIRDLEIIAAGGFLNDPAEHKGLEPEDAVGPLGEGHKFPLPNLPLPPQSHLKERYHPVLHQLTNLMMRDGKKSVAQRNMAMVLNFLRTSPAPIVNPRFPLLPGSPPPSHLPLNPVLYLTLAIDSVAPLVRIRYIKGGAGGGQNLEMPFPLAVRQRRRQAFQWMLDVVDKKKTHGSGRTQLAHRIAQEVIAVVEGRSPLWERRLGVHKIGTAARANLSKRVMIKKGPGN